MSRSAPTPFVLRTGLRLLGRPSADPRDVGARLDRALRSASCDGRGAPPKRTQPVQVVGTAHVDSDAYHTWRAQQLRRLSGGCFPELEEGRWAMVLFAMPLTAVAAFVTDGGPSGLLGPPVVGRFDAGITLDVGLAATLVAWLEGGRHSILLAPPLLGRPGGPCRVAALRRAWPLPVSPLALRESSGTQAQGPGDPRCTLPEPGSTD